MVCQRLTTQRLSAEKRKKGSDDDCFVYYDSPDVTPPYQRNYLRPLLVRLGSDHPSQAWGGKQGMILLVRVREMYPQSWWTTA